MNPLKIFDILFGVGVIWLTYKYVIMLKKQKAFLKDATVTQGTIVENTCAKFGFDTVCELKYDFKDSQNNLHNGNDRLVGKKFRQLSPGQLVNVLYLPQEPAVNHLEEEVKYRIKWFYMPE